MEELLTLYDLTKELKKMYNEKDIQYNENYIDTITDIFNNDNLNYDLTDKNILNIIGLYYRYKIKNYDEMIKYYLMAIDLNDDKAMYNLARYYLRIRDFNEMKKYYLMAIELNNSGAMCRLAVYYEYFENNFDEMKIYYLMAIELNDVESMYYLAMYYQYVENNIDKMKKYLLMGIELNDSKTMYGLGHYYQYNEINYDEMKKYYQMSAELKNINAINCLACYYSEIEQNYDKTKKYFLMSIELNDNEILIFLDNFFRIETQHYLFKNINSKIAIEKVKELEENNFLGVRIFKDLTEYVFNPQRLVKLCNIYNIELNDYMDII